MSLYNESKSIQEIQSIKDIEFEKYAPFFEYRLLEKCTQLTCLDIGVVDRTDDAFADFLEKMTNLKTFQMHGTYMMGAPKEQMPWYLPPSEGLVRRTKEETDIPFHFLSQLSSLTISCCNYYLFYFFSFSFHYSSGRSSTYPLFFLFLFLLFFCFFLDSLLISKKVSFQPQLLILFQRSIWLIFKSSIAIQLAPCRNQFR